MAQAVADAFNHNQQRLIEAGTGTGKSAAYLAPAALWAARSGERVIISTQTINLQEQLFSTMTFLQLSRRWISRFVRRS